MVLPTVPAQPPSSSNQDPRLTAMVPQDILSLRTFGPSIWFPIDFANLPQVPNGLLDVLSSELYKGTNLDRDYIWKCLKAINIRQLQDCVFLGRCRRELVYLEKERAKATAASVRRLKFGPRTVESLEARRKTPVSDDRAYIKKAGWGEMAEWRSKQQDMEVRENLSRLRKDDDGKDDDGKLNERLETSGRSESKKRGPGQ